MTVSSSHLTITVANEAVKDSLERAASDLPITIKLHNHVVRGKREPFIENGVDLHKYGHFFFARDFQVTLESGKIYIPHKISYNSLYLDLRVRGALPPILGHFIENKNLGELAVLGHGLDSDSQAIAIDNIRRENLPHKIGITALEGGQVFTFKDGRGIKKAIVGELSIYVTHAALEDQFYFTEERLKDIIESITELSDDQIYQARNYVYTLIRYNFEVSLNTLIAKQKRKEISKRELKKESLRLKEEFGQYCKEYNIDPLDFFQSHRRQVTSQDRILFRERAIRIQARLILTKKTICKDLEVEEANTAFILQDGFHIDMNNFVLPKMGGGGTLFYHSRSESLKLLDNLLKYEKKPRFRARLLAYKKNSRTSDNLLKMELINKRRLERIGCHAIGIPGAFEGIGFPSSNFMNMQMYNDVLFVPGSSYPLLERRFKRALLREDPALSVRFLHSKEKSDFIFEFYMTHCRGSLRCLSNEVYPSSSSDVEEHKKA